MNNRLHKIIIIAEAGVNHNGQLRLAKKLVDVASESGADYVKFQTFKTSKVVSSSAQKANYQKLELKGDTQKEMLEKLELPYSDFRSLLNYCISKNIKFLSTAFDNESLDFLVDLGVDYIKIPSGELTNKPFLINAAKKNIPIILSTGMSNLNEVREAFELLLNSGSKRESICVLQCNTEYPTDYEDLNLNVIQTFIEEFNTDVGLSDHSLGVHAPLVAIGLGARVIEKHFTLDKGLSGPDHKASLSPEELKLMVKQIRDAERALGDKVKTPTNSELKNIDIARRSIHTSKNIKQGDQILLPDLIMLRPGDGISPMNIQDVIGKKAFRDIAKGEKLNFDDIK